MLRALAVSLFVLTTATSGYVSLQHLNPETTAWRESGPVHVALIGDSLSWQAKSSIESSLSQADMDARISVNPGHALSSPWAQDTLGQDVEGDTFGAIVLETASNDAIQVEKNVVPVAQYARLLHRVIDLARDKCVVIMNAKVRAWYYQSSDARAINHVIAVAAATHSNVRVVDWNLEAVEHPSWFGPDLLHLYPGLPATILASDSPGATSQGIAERGFAQALQLGIDSCGSATRT